MSACTKQTIWFLCYKICIKKHRCYSWPFANEDFQSNEFSTWQRSDSFYQIIFDKLLCLSAFTRGIRNSLSCRNANATKLKEQRNNWFVQKFPKVPWKRPCGWIIPFGKQRDREYSCTMQFFSKQKNQNRKREPSAKKNEIAGLFSMLHRLWVARREEMIQIWKLFVKLSLLMTKK